MSARRIALLSVLLGLAVTLATPPQVVGQEGPAGQAVDVVVQNRTSWDVRVYALQEGHMVPLGLVTDMARATYPLPQAFMQAGEPIHLVADPIEPTTWYKSDPVRVRPAQGIEFTIESDLDRSTVSVGE